MQEATSLGSPQSLKKIGAGTCGLVYQQSGQIDVVKVAAHSNGIEQLWTEYKHATKIITAFQRAKALMDLSDVRVPQHTMYLDFKDQGAGQKWFDSNKNGFSEEIPQYAAYVMERILPLHRAFRVSLINQFASETQREAALRASSNNDCIARVYLGSRRSDAHPRESTRPARIWVPQFNLRNYPIHADQFEAIGFDTSSYAKSMARCLAVMHWFAQNGANDVEFVLGSAPIHERVQVQYAGLRSELYHTTDVESNMHRRGVYLWMLDFDKVRDIAFNGELANDEAQLADMAKAFLRNDPYFPRPLSANTSDQRLWSIFKQEYIRASASVLYILAFSKEGMYSFTTYPARFIEAVVATQQQIVNDKSKILAVMAAKEVEDAQKAA